MLGLLNKALETVYNQENIFLTARVNQILWDGVLINCNVSDFTAKGFCQILRTEAKGLDHVTEHLFKFSFFGSVRFLSRRSGDFGRLSCHFRLSGHPSRPTDQLSQVSDLLSRQTDHFKGVNGRFEASHSFDF